MIKVLFLCHGNICRSPIAEFVFKNMTEGLDIYTKSKAVSREEIGNSIYPPAQKVLNAHSIPFDDHRASQITREDYEFFDYVVIMEEYNMPRLLRIIGKDDLKKVSRLLDFTDHPSDIEDPWYTGNFERVYDQIKTGCEALLNHIKANGI